MIELRGVHVAFARRRSFGEVLRGLPAPSVRAVDGVDLELRRGEIVALVGESGSGKTTTGRAIVRLAPISEGQVLMEGRDVTAIRGVDLRAYRRRVQIIFQDPYESLDPRRSVTDQVTEPLIVQGIGTRPERRERVDRALEEAGLRPVALYRDRYPHELSGGQRQRVAIASAMVLEPDVLVADEPVSMLDVSLRSGILRVMLDLREKRGIGILFITHDLSLAWLIADRIAVMYLGRIVEVGPAETLVRDPRHPYTKALLSVMPSPDPARRRKRAILRGETPDPSRIPAGCRFHTRCPLVFDRCRVEDPPDFDLGDGRRSACWLAEGGEPLPDFPAEAPRLASASAHHASAKMTAEAASAEPSLVEPDRRP
ncbi:dipeptide ABC transporter ATP-binding protein [soil metagenome]